MKRNFSIIIISIAVCLAATLFIMNVLNGSKQIGIHEGMTAESIVLEQFDGESIEVFEQTNQVTILNIWATWCEPCVRELPDLMDLEEDYRDEGLSVLTLNAQKFERVPENTYDFIREHELTLPVFLDAEGEFFQLYQVQGMPTTLVLDQDHVIVKRIEGEVHYGMLEEIILPLLNES